LRDVESDLLLVLFVNELGLALYFIPKADLGRRSGTGIAPEIWRSDLRQFNIMCPMELKIKAIGAIDLVLGQKPSVVECSIIVAQVNAPHIDTLSGKVETVRRGFPNLLFRLQKPTFILFKHVMDVHTGTQTCRTIR